MAPQIEATVTAFSTKINFDLIKSKLSSSMWIWIYQLDFLFWFESFYIFVDFKYRNNAAVEIGEITGE
jgi:hypothetical protein